MGISCAEKEGKEKHIEVRNNIYLLPQFIAMKDTAIEQAIARVVKEHRSSGCKRSLRSDYDVFL